MSKAAQVSRPAERMGCRRPRLLWKEWAALEKAVYVTATVECPAWENGRDVMLAGAVEMVC